MSWVGLRDRQRGFFNEAGLGQASADPVDLNGILPKGTLMMSFSVSADQVGRSTMLLRQKSTSPWLSAISFDLGENGEILFQQKSGDRTCVAVLPAKLSSRIAEVILTYTWNAPARTGMLSIENGDTGDFFCVSVADPLPLSLRDAVMLTRHPDGCELTSCYDFLAVADHTIPHGPLPSLTAETFVSTPTGQLSVSRLRQGDLVITEDGLTAQVRWAGSLNLPCRGRFTPLTLRAPFFGAYRDLQVASHQRIELSGTEVDYLFASDRVSVRVGDLPSHVLRPTATNRFTKTYFQVLLDRDASLGIGGLSVEPLDVTTLSQNQELRSLSILRDLPAEMMPSARFKGSPKLKNLETMTLCHLMAA